ncbi:MAG: PKD domain-containing protein [Chryseolinea sp.]
MVRYMISVCHLRIRALCLLLVICPNLNAQNKTSLVDTDLTAAFTTRDSIFRQPYIDVDEWRDKPMRHRYVHGGFKGTGTKFSFYFPPQDNYRARFFQYITPFPDHENLSQGAEGEADKIGFSVSHGAYFIETNGGGAIDFSNMTVNDPTIGAYRANAASAQFSRVVSQKIFGGTRAFGYAFGGSGGAYRTVGGIENTEGVWDGVVPYVLGSPMAIPSVFSVRMHAMRILHNKLPQIVDAVEPGGSGNMYTGLNEEEAAALKEVTQMGFPPRSWYGYKQMGVHGFLVLYQGVVMADGQYFQNDFWNKPGYLGYAAPKSLLEARIQKTSTIKSAIALDEAIRLGLSEPVSDADRGSADNAWKSMGGSNAGKPVAFVLEDVLPDVNFMGGDLIIKSGDAAGNILQIVLAKGNHVALAPTNPLPLLMKLKAGDTVQVDNSNFLASQTYHRHQVPGPEYKVWDQFRDANGRPIYPQRPMLLGPLFTKAASGSLPVGKFKGKMILLGSLLDREAFPWQCDWYRQRVNEHSGDDADKNFRLWYTENALHGDLSSQLDDATHAVSYLGVLQQALLDLSDWVERGVAPPASTSYSIRDGQIEIPKKAAERGGIQPVVTVTVNKLNKIETRAGKAITIDGMIELPPGTGEIILAEWDFDGSGEFQEKRTLTSAKEQKGVVAVSTTHTFTKPGTYFPTLRVTSQRVADPTSPFARVRNLGRVRVVVK